MRKIFCIAAAFAAALLPGCNENENNSVAVTDISLDRIVLEMVEGDTATLHASLLPAEAAGSETVEWESSDLSVATVDEGGKVTAVAAGNAVITARVRDLSAACPVVVIKPAFEFIPDMAESGYALNAFSNTSEVPVLDEAVIWLRSSDYTLEKDPEYSGNIKQTGRELQVSLNIAAGSDKVIPEGTYVISPISDYTPDEYEPMTSFSYYTIEFYELGTFYADYDTGEKFVPVSGNIVLGKSGNTYTLDIEMYDENSERFVCRYSGELLFNLDTFDKYLMY